MVERLRRSLRHYGPLSARTLRAFVEAPAGLASVSLRLHGGEHCRPPISRMGNKAGYSSVILAALGLRSGGGAQCYWWAEADPDVAALLRCYPDAALLRRVAEIIRGWAGEEPRALWERLRGERKARVAVSAEEGTAGWILSQAWAAHGKDANHYHGPGAHPCKTWTGESSMTGRADACHRLAEYATIVSSNRLINMSGPALMNTGNGGTRFGGEFATPVEDVAGAFERVAGEVAGFAVASSWSYEQGNLRTGFVGPGERRQDTTATATATARLAVGGWPPVRVTATIPTAAELSEALGTPGDLDGVVVYMDPPYKGTTGYAHSLGRDEVVAHALDFDRMGAVVCISEAVPLPELPDWYTAEITAGRKGQARTFSKQKREWLTMNRPPAHIVATQTSMFGAAK